MAEEVHQSAGYETRDVSIRAIIGTGIVLAVVVALTCVIVFAIFRYFVIYPPETLSSNPMEAERANVPPNPRIEPYPAEELKVLRAHEDEVLSTYGWVDKNAGVVRIPIDRAIDLQLQRGFPARTKAARK